jgi:sugar phosphate isomerase/epimerase
MYLGARAYSIEDVEFLAEAGYDFAEVDWQELDVVRAQMGELSVLRAQHGIDYLAHGPNEGDPFGTDHHATWLEPTVNRLLDMAGEMEIPLYTQHLWLDARFVSAEIVAAKIELLGRWTERAQRAGVTLCIENLSEHADHFAPAFERVPGLGLTLDLGHGQILAPEERGNASFELIDRFADRIRHVHLHDNLGGDRSRDDLHLPLGQGKVDFAGILRALREAGYGGGFSLEVKLQHVERGRARICELWDAVSCPGS